MPTHSTLLPTLFDPRNQPDTPDTPRQEVGNASVNTRSGIAQ